MLVAIYCRVSTQEQALHGHSIDEQIDRMRKYCDAMHWTVYKVYTDAGFSGASTDRPALQSLIRDVEKGNINKVLVYKLDRLSRAQKDTLMLIEDVFLANNTDFVSMNENFDTSTPFGRAMIGILAVFAQLEREQIKERMMMGKDARAKLGKFTGYSPIGYTYKDDELITNEFEKMQVIRVFSEYANGKSLNKIATELNNAGLTHKYGKWNGQTVHNVLTKKTYLGYISYNGKWYKGSHEAFIDEKVFEQVQKMINKRGMEYKLLNRRAGKNNSYLGGLIYCKHCESKYSKITRRRHGQTYYYYSCYSRSRRASPLATSDHCRNKNWQMGKLDQIIFDEIKKLSLDPNFEKNSKTEDKDDSLLIREKIKEIESQIDKLMTLYTVKEIPLDLLQSKISSLNEQANKLKFELETMEEEKKEKLNREDVLRIISTFGDVLDRGDIDEVHSVVSMLIDRIEIDNENITIKWAFS